MSLISDTDFLIHSLRLSYLRNVEDPYGPRLITLDPSYNSNPYIVAASLADVERWPELAAPSSPQLSEDDGERPSGFPGATGLKHTQTIMGGRTGGLGLRVSAKRTSSSKRLSGTPRQGQVKNFVSESHLVHESGSLPNVLPEQSTGSWNKGEDTDSADPPAVQVQEATAPSEPPVAVAKTVQFIPKFKGAAEMEARRKLRMLARNAPAAQAAPPPPPVPLSIDFSSSDEDEQLPLEDDDSSDDGIEVDDDDDDDFDHAGANDSMDDGDDFDPDFAAAPTPGVNSDGSFAISVLSAGTASMTSSSSVPGSSSQANGSLRLHPRLSPVSEARTNDDSSVVNTPIRESIKNVQLVATPAKVDDSPRFYNPRRLSGQATTNVEPPVVTPASPTQMAFPRRQVAPIRPLQSALTAMLASTSGSTNPFAEMYAAISGRAETASMTVRVYFPHATQPMGEPMDLNVRKDASMEEVIGFALWTYWEEGWLPKLDEGLSGEDDPKWATRLSAVGWIMRIAEDDGEVDDEFPPPDRMGKISKFNFDAYAVLEATPAQIQQNQILETKIQRRPSRATTAKRPERSHTPALTLPMPAGPGTSAVFGSSLGSLPLSTSLGPSSSHGPQIFLRIRVADHADAVHISTTIPVSAGMYMQEALELVCRKRKLPDPKDYALLLKGSGDTSILIPLDRTVASLQGKRELLLVNRSMLNEISLVKGPGRTTDPNASIFKRMSDTPATQQSSALDYTAAYKKYTVYRKMPMLVTRQERTLAIDGVYIHIMPTTNKAKAVFDNGKTFSHHIKSIVDCQQSTKSSAIFKLILMRAGGNKRYDFEAENPKTANEIVQTIRGLKTAMERSGTFNKSRRSRHVV